MTRAVGWGPLAPWAAAGFVAAAGDLLIGRLLVHRGVGGGTVLMALVPAVLVTVAALITSDRSFLAFVALALAISLPPVTAPISFGGASLYSADFVAALALLSWVGARLLRRKAHGTRAAAISGWGFVLFVAAILQGVVRGHENYGLKLISDPMRLVLYAAIALALTEIDSERLYRGIVWLFYVGTVWQLLNGAFYIAKGTSQTDQIDVSTGGHRYLALSTAMYLAAALFLALLNLQIEQSARRRALHLTIAVLAGLGIALSLGRSTFIAVAIVLPLLLVFSPRVRNPLLAILPLAVPILVLLLLVLPQAVPGLGAELGRRVSASPSTDVNGQWRVQAGTAIWDQQARRSPVVGVGFGRNEPFVFKTTVNGIPTPRDDLATQDPHDGYLYLLGGGGAVALGAFALVLLAFLREAWRRLRSPLHPHERVLVLWSVATLFVFLVNTGTGLVLQSPASLLTVWVLLVIPSVVGATRVRNAA
jgi:hypothetical protein